MKIVTVIGARPQFIKAALLSNKLREKHLEIIIHTGQHYDKNISDVFFQELEIPLPDYNLAIGSATHGKQTGKMLIKIEEKLMIERPDYVIVYGDTNSTLAAALAASKLNISLIHIESGLRSFDKKMPEEKNRIITDHLSSILFCPTQNAVKNLQNEGIKEGVYNVGDIMYDLFLKYKKVALYKSKILEKLNLEKENYYLATIHRAENTDNKNKLSIILKTLNILDKKVLFPAHPRTINKIKAYNLQINSYKNISFIESVGYLDMLKLLINCQKVLTDSGGLQKEAYFASKPCITLRNSTEWLETLTDNWNILVDINTESILKAVKSQKTKLKKTNKKSFGNGDTFQRIIQVINKLEKGKG
ncbi:MAG: non-hydrolyzing UDP-N-acetylglucosamine 2-epimerase [Halanaerobiales bacterium]